MNRLFPLALLGSFSAAAYSVGISSRSFNQDGCNQCHQLGTAPAVSLTAPATLAAGADATLTLTISTTNGQRAGFNIRADKPGTFAVVGSSRGSKVRLEADAAGQPEATHSLPKSDEEDGATDGVVTFELTWKPPAGFGGNVVFTAWGNSVNGDGRNTGDRGAVDTKTTAVTCTPTSCAAEQKNCGSIPDKCGATLECGSCTAGQTCGGGGTPNVCGCTPKSCAAQGKNCGTLPDGCGGTLECGTCNAGTCSNNVCAGCTPTTSCQAQGRSCGTIDDGCATVSCGSCPDGQTCGGGGTPGVCGAGPPQGCGCGSKGPVFALAALLSFLFGGWGNRPRRAGR